MRVIETDSPLAMDLIFNPNARPLKQEVVNIMPKALYNTLSEGARNIAKRSSEIYNNIANNNIIAKAKRALQRSEVTTNSNVIIYLPIEKIHNSNPYMQRFLMAEPTIRKLFLNNQVDGWAYSYDSPNDDIGEDHLDYRMVTDGVMQFSNKEDNYYFKFYTEYEIEDDDELDGFEKIDIIQMWEEMKKAISEGKDPTSPDQEAIL